MRIIIWSPLVTTQIALVTTQIAFVNYSPFEVNNSDQNRRLQLLYGLLHCVLLYVSGINPYHAVFSLDV